MRLIAALPADKRRCPPAWNEEQAILLKGAYHKPKPGDVVTYRWNSEEEHELVKLNRTGVIYKRSGEAGKQKNSNYFIRMYNGRATSKSYQCDVSEHAWSKNWFFRRPDLLPGHACHDRYNDRWCIIQSINKRTGGLYVLYEGDDHERLVSPDTLTGTDYPSPSRS